MLQHWSQFVPNASSDIRGHEALLHHLNVHRVEVAYQGRGQGGKGKKKSEDSRQAPPPPKHLSRQARVCHDKSMLVATTFLLRHTCLSLTTLVYLLKLLYVNSCVVGGRMARNLFFFFCPLYVFIYFSAAFCTTHCALDLRRDHAP